MEQAKAVKTVEQEIIDKCQELASVGRSLVNFNLADVVDSVVGQGNTR